MTAGGAERARGGKPTHGQAERVGIQEALLLKVRHAVVDLEQADAIRFFDNWSKGNTIQRTLSSVVKQFVYVSYWRDPATWGPIRFDGPVSDRWGIPSLGNTPLPVESEEVSA